MDEEESKIKHPSLPQGYVSLDQLRERWLQKQQEQKLKEEMQQLQLEKKKLEEKMKKERLQRNKFEEEMKQKQQKKKLEQKVIQAREHGNHKVLQNREFEKQAGAIEEEESAKGKGIQNNGEEKKKKKKNTWRKKKESLEGVEKDNTRIGNDCKIEELDAEMEQPNEILGGEIVSKVEHKPGNEGNVSKVVGLPRIGGREDSNVKVGGRFRRNDNHRAGGGNFLEYRVKPKDNRVEVPLGELGDEKGNGTTWRKKSYMLKKNLAEIDGLKGNELEIKSEKLPKDEILGMGSKIVGINGNGLHGKGERDQREDLNDKSQDDDSVIEEKKVGGNGESENGLIRFPNRRNNSVRKFGEWSVSSVDNERARLEMNVGYNRRHASYGRSNGWKPRQGNSQMVWVKKDDNLRANNTAEVGSTGISPGKVIEVGVKLYL